jgi:nicotinamide-nucleotide amidase
MDDAALETLARAIGARLLARGEWLATAESCTGGLIAKLLTDIPGSSVWFERGLVTYSNRAKQQLLAVPGETLETFGAVSAPTALAMAKGLLAAAPVQWTVAVTGIAGPDGGTAEKPVGTVWIGWAGAGAAPSASRFRFAGGRDAVRRASAAAALAGLSALLEAGA